MSGVGIRSVRCTMHEHVVMIAFVNVELVFITILIFLIHLVVTDRKGRVDVLRLRHVLSGATLLQTGVIGMLQWAIFVQSSTDKVSAVWEFWRARAKFARNSYLSIVIIGA